MKKRTNCKFVIISIRAEIIRLVRVKAYKFDPVLISGTLPYPLGF